MEPLGVQKDECKTFGGLKELIVQLGRQGMYTKVWGDKQKPGLNLSH